LRIAHRLDANTTGVVVFCRTAAAAAIVQPQFERRQVEKQYLARVRGHVPWQEYRCQLEIGDAICFGNTNTAGARVTHRSGQPAETLFHCLDRFDDGTSLLQVSPITGRTNQIRVHAAAIGFPIAGDPFYATSHAKKSGPDGRRTQTLGVNEPAMCLHAWRIGLVHPGTLEQIALESQTTGWKPMPHPSTGWKPMPHPNTGWKPMPLTFESTPPDWAKWNYSR
jgi:RluA family pseudouridine synthase